MDKIHKNKLNFYNKNTGRNMRYYRKQQLVSQDEIATYLNLDKSTISLYENGKVNIPVKYVYAISQILNIDINIFFQHHDEKFKNLMPNKSKGSSKKNKTLITLRVL